MIVYVKQKLKNDNNGTTASKWTAPEIVTTSDLSKRLAELTYEQCLDHDVARRILADKLVRESEDDSTATCPETNEQV